MNTEQKIERWAEREIKNNLHILIIDDEQGGHIAFGNYYIQPTNQGVAVYSLSKDLVGKFSNKRTALSYCVADKFNRLNLAIQIKNLDTKKQILADDIACQQGLNKRSRSREFQEMVQTKIYPKLTQYNSVCRELEKCVISAKYLQLKGFQNETARVFTSQAY